MTLPLIPAIKRLFRLSGPLIHTQVYAELSGDIVFPYPGNPLDTKEQIRICVDAIGSVPTDPDDARIEEIPLPSIPTPSWTSQDIINEWHEWRKLEWLHEWMQPKSAANRSDAECALRCYFKR